MLTADGQRQLLAGEVAKLLNVGVQTLHFYEREGLIPAPPRTDAGYRLYPVPVVERLRFIKRAQALGLPLTEVREILLPTDRGGSPCGRVQEALEQKLAEADRRLVELRRFRRELAILVKNAKTGYAERPAAQVCPIVEHADLPTRAESGPSASRPLRARGRKEKH